MRLKPVSFRPSSRIFWELCLVGTIAAATACGRWALLESERASQAAQEALWASSEAAVLRSREAQYSAALEEFRVSAQRLARDVEGGWVLDALSDAASRAKVKLVFLEPSQPVEGFYEGHLRGVPYRLEVLGSGPAVETFLAMCESLPCPGELRQFSIAVDETAGIASGQVRASCLLVLYSTNPPLAEDLLPSPEQRKDAWAPPASWTSLPENNQPAPEGEVPSVESGTGVPSEAGR